MMLIKQAGFLTLLIILLAACQDADMQKKFGSGPKILTDKNGQQFVVEHNIGNAYRISPLE